MGMESLDCCHTKRSSDVRQGFAFFRGKLTSVTFQVVEGYAIFEGDIVLGTIKEIEVLTALVLERRSDMDTLGARLSTGTWPYKRLPYCVAPSAPHPDLIVAAATHWREITGLDVSDFGPFCNMPTEQSFVIETVAVPVPWPASFAGGNGCSSQIGYQGRSQQITVGEGCLFGQIVHEIGHAVGLFHEQSRPDRDQYVEILYENIQDDMRFNFDIFPNAVPSGPYDYGSIMHYGPYDFSKNGKPTIRPRQSGAQIGQRLGLSPGDVAAVRAMYP